MRRICLALAALAAAVAMTGCASIKSQTAAQQDVIGPVQLTTEFCAPAFGKPNVAPPARTVAAPVEGGANPGACESAGDVSAMFDTGQFLVAYLVPDGITLPASLSATLSGTPAPVDSAPLAGTPAGGRSASLTFTQDAGQKYAAAAAAQDGALPGTHWVSYVSDVTSITSAPDPLDVSLPVPVPLPKPADGSPYEGPLAVKTQLGDRIVDTAEGSPLSADRPIDCTESLLDNKLRTISPAVLRARTARAVLAALRRHGARAHGAVAKPPFDTTVCFDGDAQATSAATNDLGILPGTPAASGLPGTTVAVPFNAEWAGQANEAANFTLTAATNLAGATATPVNGTLIPPAGGDTTPSTTPETVNVTIPANAAPGSYTATLTASLANGQTRSGTATFMVGTPPPSQPQPPANSSSGVTTTVDSGPSLAETLAPLAQLTIPDLVENGVPVTFGCNKACDATLDLLVYFPPAHRAGIAWHAVRTVVIGRLFSGLTAAGTKSARIKPFPLPADGLQHLGRFTLMVRTTATDAAGEHTQAIVRKVHLHPGCSGPACVPF